MLPIKLFLKADSSTDQHRSYRVAIDALSGSKLSLSSTKVLQNIKYESWNYGFSNMGTLCHTMGSIPSVSHIPPPKIKTDGIYHHDGCIESMLCKKHPEFWRG